MKDKIQLNCPVCQRMYDADPTRLKHGRQTTCSRACSYQLRAAAKQNGTEHQCAVCGESFYRSPAQIKSRHGKMFCSRKCAYQMRERVVSRPYVLVAQVDWSAASHKAWETRRRNAKPYPDAAREKARARAIERLQHGYAVSKFEMEVAEVLRRLGVAILTGAAVRNEDGTFAGVFDIVIPSRRILIECHGTYWHGGRWSWDDADATQRKNLMHEERKAIIARALGFDLRVLWEHEFKRDHIGACLSAIR